MSQDAHKSGNITAIFLLAVAVSLLMLWVLLAAWPNIQFELKERNGVALFRRSPDRIWLTWNMESGASISPWHSLQWLSQSRLGEADSEWTLPDYFVLTPHEKTWLFDLSLYNGTPATFANLVNPKLSNAEDKIHNIIHLAQDKDRNMTTITGIAAESYIFLGWVVRNAEDVAALRETLTANWEGIDRDADLETNMGTLYRLAPGVERHFATNADDTRELARLRAEIPVMFEHVNRDTGHPADEMHVLYLDGHIDVIPYGERFPATDAFHQALYPDEVKNP